jgi:hypothetical protein
MDKNRSGFSCRFFHVSPNSALITARAADFPLSEAPATRERPQTAANQIPDGCAHTGAQRLLWHDPNFSRGGFLWIVAGT